MSNEREPRRAMLVSALVAVVLQVLPLPDWLASARPAFLLLVVIYWSLIAPRAGGLTLAFFAGVLLDVFKGAVLGQYAIATVLVGYIAIRQSNLIRNKPVFQQAVFVAVVSFLWELVLWAIGGWSGQSVAGFARWIPVLTNALVWPLAAFALSRTHAVR